jgi:hypothetical protein
METACACTNYQSRSTGFTGKHTPLVSEQRKLSNRNLKCAKVIIRQFADVFVVDLLFPDAHVRDLADDIEQCKTWDRGMLENSFEDWGSILLELWNQVRHTQLLQ